MFSEPKTDAFPAIVKSNGEAGDSSVKGIMDYYCLVQGTWHGHHAARVQQSTRVKGILTACCVFGPNKIHATSPGSNVKSINIKMWFDMHHSVFRQVPCIVSKNNSKKITI